MGQYDAVAQRTLDTITRKGGVVTFPGTASGGIYDPLTDSWSGPGSADKTGRAVQIDGDPDTLRALGLISANSLTLMIAAKNLEVIPDAGVAIVWAGKTYTIRAKEEVAPDGTPILYIAVASA